jgi:hypothetical protein
MCVCSVAPRVERFRGIANDGDEARHGGRLNLEKMAASLKRGVACRIHSIFCFTFVRPFSAAP